MYTLLLYLSRAHNLLLYLSCEVIFPRRYKKHYLMFCLYWVWSKTKIVQSNRGQFSDVPSSLRYFSQSYHFLIMVLDTECMEKVSVFLSAKGLEKIGMFRFVTKSPPLHPVAPIFLYRCL